MNNTKKTLLIFGIILFFSFCYFNSTVWAQSPPGNGSPPGPGDEPPSPTELQNPMPGIGSIEDLAGTLVKWVLGLVATVAVLVVVIGGILYMTSGGSPKQLEMAKNTVIYAIIGIVVIALSGIIINTIIKILKK
ncbi:hypothetical protein COY23_00895 [bacterium (Candidatus Torokbacteria) CG_4_10_14_0_2_um_filter_35_8]|nr:MAG: hypothetical protein COY23_00895 [bacterium (Candidatus Torokbacteria) CG_4_10_14_0_2_um_filter_35_8]